MTGSRSRRFLVRAFLVAMSPLGACASGGEGARDSSRGSGPDAAVVDAWSLDAPFPRDAGSMPDVGSAPDAVPTSDSGPTVDAARGADADPTACSPPCRDDERCVMGMCRCGAAVCSETQTCCGGGCVDTRTNPMHCGRCGNACPAGQTCMGGACMTSCTVSCPAGTTCMGDRCLCGTGAGARACAAGEECCSGSCVRLDTVANCGACGRVCAGSEQCCGGLCVNTRADRNNCGACGRRCGDRADGCTEGSCTCGGGPACFFTPCFFGMCLLE